MQAPKRLLMYSGRKETVGNDSDSDAEADSDFMINQKFNDSDPLSNRGFSPRHCAGQ